MGKIEEENDGALLVLGLHSFRIKKPKVSSIPFALPRTPPDSSVCLSVTWG